MSYVTMPALTDLKSSMIHTGSSVRYYVIPAISSSKKMNIKYNMGE